MTDLRNWPADRVERRALAALIPSARNARTHSDAQVAQITGTTATLVAYVPTYDRNGMMSAAGDPNTYSSRLECRTCGMKWDVHQRQEEMTVQAVEAE